MTSYQPTESEKLGEEIYRFERWVEEKCKSGYRLSMELMIERIVAENKLRLVERLEAAE